MTEARERILTLNVPIKLPTHEDVFIGRKLIGSYEYATGKITFSEEFLSALSAQLSEYEKEKDSTE